MLSGDAAKKALEEEFNLLPYVLDILTSIENTKDQKDELTKKVWLFISFTYLGSIECAVFGSAPEVMQLVLLFGRIRFAKRFGVG